MQFDMPTIDPGTNTGTQLATWINSWQDAIETSHAGAVRPAYVKPGMLWVEQTAANDWRLKIFDGSHDILLSQFDPTTGAPINQYLPIVGGTLSGNLNFSGLARRITGDLFGATLANRLMFQSNIVNSGSSLGIIPNGTSTVSNYSAYSDPTLINSSIAQIGTNGARVFIASFASGAGVLCPIAFDIGGGEKIRIDTSGRLLVGTTTILGLDSKLAITYGGGGTQYGIVLRPAVDITTSIIFNNVAGGNVGTITQTATATTYNTASDHRLKKNAQPLLRSAEFIDALEPEEWEWIGDGSRGVGFIAHKAQKVAPLSVTGEKDAINEAGDPIYQAMMPGSPEIIANIVAELQSLRRRVSIVETSHQLRVER